MPLRGRAPPPGFDELAHTEHHLPSLIAVAVAPPSRSDDIP